MAAVSDPPFSNEFAVDASCATFALMDPSLQQERGVAPTTPGDAAAGNRCERCGAIPALKIGARWICESCYVEAGSCCPEFGADDLWVVDEAKERSAGAE